MSDFSIPLAAWISSRLPLVVLNKRYLIEAREIDALTNLVLDEVRKDVSSQAPGISVHDVRRLLALYLVDQRDPTRAVFGSLAVQVSPVAVAGATLATIGTLLWLVSDPQSLASGSLAALTDVQAAFSAVSILTVRERHVLALIHGSARLKLLFPLQVADLAALAAE